MSLLLLFGADDVKEDTLNVTIVESSLITEVLAETFEIRAGITEQTADLTKITSTQITSSDSLLITLGESGDVSRGDGLLISLVETSSVSVSAERADSLLVVVQDVVTLCEPRIISSDNLVIDPDVEIGVIAAEIHRGETLAIALTDVGDLINVHTACDEPVRTIYGKVEITYSDPLRDETLTLSSSGEKYGSDVEDTADNLEGCNKNWFEVGVSTLDGTAYPADNEQGSVGWWSASLADADGNFSTPVTITVVLSEASDVPNLKVIGDNIKGEYPVDFTIKLYDESDTLLYTETVTGNTSWAWRRTLATMVTGVTKEVLSITKINKGSTTAKVTEFYTAYFETYYGDDLFGINLLEELEYQSGTIPIGNISSNEIAVKLNNYSRRFTPGNPISSVAPLMLKNRRIQAWLGVDIDGTTEWHSLGIFWSMDWNVPDDEVWAEVTGFDRLEFLRGTTFNPHEVFTNYTLYELIEAVLQDAGLLTAEYEIDIALDSIVIPYAWFGEETHRNALQKLAEAGLAMVYCDREGRIVVKQYAVPTSTAFTFDTDTFFSKDHPLAWSEMANSVEVTATPLTPSAQEEIYTDSDTFAVGAGATVEKFYIFSHSPCIDVQQPTITQSGTDIHVESYTVYSWAISVIFYNSGATSQNVTSVSVEGKKLESKGQIRCTAEDPSSIRLNGKVTTSINNDFIQSKAQAQDIADIILASYKDPRRDITLKCRGDIALILGDKVSAPDFRNTAFDDYVIVRQEIAWNGRLEAQVTARRA